MYGALDVTLKNKINYSLYLAVCVHKFLFFCAQMLMYAQKFAFFAHKLVSCVHKIAFCAHILVDYCLKLAFCLYKILVWVFLGTQLFFTRKNLF